MTTMKWCVAAAIVTIVAGGHGARAAEPVDFSHQIAPLLRKHCAECHAGDKRKGSLSINTRELMLKGGETAPAVVPGKPDKSEMMLLITAADPDDRMPPKKKDPLTADEIALVKRWIAEGAKWEDGFTFGDDGYEPPLKPRRPDLPPAVDGLTNPIDRLLARYYADHKATPPAPVDDAAFMRRLCLDVIGLLPPPDELDAFVADASPDKRDKLVDRLLSRDRAYAEHWLTFWNDLLRNDYRGTGYIDGGRKQITKWLYASLLGNKPYDAFVRELISPTGESEGFINGIKWRGRVNASQTRQVQFSQNIAQVFLGINMKCASCHDSFIDHWKLDDAYALAAIVSDEPIEIHRCDKPTGQAAKARFIFPELGDVDASAPRAERLGRLAELLTAPDNGRTTRTIVNRIWQRMMGRGIVHPVDAMGQRPWSEDLLDYLAADLADNGYDLKKTIALIAKSRAYQSAGEVRAERAGEGYVFAGPVARRMTAEQFMDAVWTITGAGPTKVDAPVARPAAPGAGGELIRAALVNSDPLMRSLGRPNREQVVSTRPDELSTLQALDLSNGSILAETLDRGASRLIASSGGDADRLITGLYVQALSRRPTQEELAVARGVVGDPMTEPGVADLLWAVVMLPEFQLIR